MKLLKQVDVVSLLHKADDTVKIVLTSSLEQTDDQYADEWHKLRKTTGTLYYKEGEGVSTEEILAIDETNLDRPKKRTQSQETRIKLWQCWKELTEEGKYSKSQEEFYNAMHIHFRQTLEDRYLKK